MIRKSIFLIPLLAGMIFATGTAHAAATDAQACNNARIKAAGKYDACQKKAEMAFELSTDIGALKIASSKCRTKYTAVWPKLQAKFAGTFTACDQNRFTDNGETVTDNLTVLTWEKKNDASDLHDKDNVYYYSWMGDGDVTNADGNVFDVFLGLTIGAFFGNQGDWRLPTRAELQTLLIEPYPCSTSPCIAATFGPTLESFTMTASGPFSDPTSRWVVQFGTEELTLMAKTSAGPVRAVRGGF